MLIPQCLLMEFIYCITHRPNSTHSPSSPFKICVTHPNQPPAGGQNPNLRQQIHGPGRCDFSRPCFRVKKAQNEVEKVHAMISKWEEEAQRQRLRRHVSALLAVHLHAWRVIFSIYLACLGEAITCAETFCPMLAVTKRTPEGRRQMGSFLGSQGRKLQHVSLPRCRIARQKQKQRERAERRRERSIT